MASVFTRIIEGELPCHKVHEDDLTFSFLAVPPCRPGHVLVVPREEVDHFTDVPEESYARVMANARMVARAVREALGCARVGLAVQGFEVPHFHCHVVPMDGPADLDLSGASPVSDGEMRGVLGRIRSRLRPPPTR